MAFQAQLPINRTKPEVVVELTADTPLFGMNSKTDQILITFQEIFKELLHIENNNGELSYKKDFDAESIKHIILSKLDYGCLGPSPNVVILEPGMNPNSDEEILRAAEMYKKDFNLKDSDFLDIVADEAIYHRLIKGKKKWPKLRLHLGQWHTSKDFCSVLLVLFSSYGLLSLASRLGVRFLDKFEIAVDYRSTARILGLLWIAVGIAINIYITSKNIPFSEIMDGKNDTHICLKVWYLYYKWAGIWKAHRMGIRIGNFNIQRDSLAAVAPLFASAAKSNYTTAIAHFLSTIAAHPQLEENLHHVGSFKIPHNNTVLHTERTSESRRESLWNLVDDLINVFGMSDPLSHNLFKEYPPTELHHQGVECLIACYEKGLERIKAVYRQEVLEIECRNARGRRKTEVVRTRVKDFNQKKSKNKTGIKSFQQASGSSNQADNLESPYIPESQNNLVKVPKKKRKQTTPEEEKILEELLVYKEELPDSAINEILSRLSSNWNKAKVKAAWRYRKSKVSE
ncbi:hypothetical protein GLOIN_2v1480545 [Rhizophagus irregularis DAOM 181602=DAOM 197198]|nr:hypothetical protein GLOIN_2v1480545 [Rhizophagus irregularis DAOM 181602=DAOM 197198]